MTWRVVTILEMIKWQHTVFALPMALASVALAADAGPPHTPGWWAWRLLLIVAACFAARSAAMTYNRWADREIDAVNPRTANRPSVTGRVSPAFMLGFVAVCSLAFVGIAAMLNPLALVLSVPTLAVLLGYSHAKRFTAASHLWLGLALGLAPMGAWIAVLGRLGWPPAVLGLAVVTWVAGFDILYALEDVEHDQREGLFSVPAWLGAARAKAVAAALHCLTVALLGALALVADLGTWFLGGVLVGAGLLLLEHRLVQPHDLSRLPTAFLTLNGLFSVAVLLGVLLDVVAAA